MGNEVIGIDTSMAKVESYKEKITHTIQMDATEEYTVSGLPLRETDVVIIAIGEDQGANLMTTALFKNLEVKRLISRAINPLHEKVLQAIGVDEIMHPEEETARRWAKKLGLSGVSDSYELSRDYSVIETKAPTWTHGKKAGEIPFKEKYGLALLTIIKQVNTKSLLGKNKTESKIQGVDINQSMIEENDLLVLFGDNKDLRGLVKG